VVKVAVVRREPTQDMIERQLTACLVTTHTKNCR
jgi:hypothetical protein